MNDHDDEGETRPSHTNTFQHHPDWYTNPDHWDVAEDDYSDLSWP
jgi:hypothetical protein